MHVINSTCLIAIIINDAPDKEQTVVFVHDKLISWKFIMCVSGRLLLPADKKASKGSATLARLRNGIVASFSSSTMDFNFATIASWPMVYKFLVRNFTLVISDYIAARRSGKVASTSPLHGILLCIFIPPVQNLGRKAPCPD